MARKSIVSIALVICLSMSIFLQMNPSLTENAAAQGGEDDAQYPWSMFRGSLNNSGYSTSTVPETSDTFFEFMTTLPIWSSPVYYDFKIFFGAEDSKVYAVEVATETEVWSNSTSGSVQATPLIVNNTLYVGSTDSLMYAFNASTGEQLWTFDTGGGIVSSAKYYNGTIIFGSNDGKLYAINATYGTHVWNFTTGSDVWSSPAISNDHIFFGSLDGYVYCLYANNGTEKWNFSSASPWDDVYSSPSVHNGNVFVGFAINGIGDNGILVALNETTGTLKWYFNTTGFVYSSPAVHNEKVFFGTASYDWKGDSYVYALPEVDPNGDGMIDQDEIVWKVVSNDYEEGGSSPAVADGKVLIGSRGGNVLMCVNETTGEIVWNLTLSDGIVSSPLVVDGKVFVGANNNTMYGIGSSGLPFLNIEITPESPTIKGGRTMTIYFTVTHNNEPVEGAFINVWVTNGTLTQSGFSTFSDGSQKVKFMAPAVDENRTITITAEVAKYGFEEGFASAQFIIEPAEKYDTVTSEDWFAILAKYSIYLIIIIALVILNITTYILVRKKRKEREEGENRK